MKGILMQPTTTPGVDILIIMADQPLLGIVVLEQAGKKVLLCVCAVNFVCHGLLCKTVSLQRTKASWSKILQDLHDGAAR